MSLKCGIVGLPNVGKSTLFNALIQANVPTENYPFCTIHPNIGLAHVPDKRILTLSRIVQPEKISLATVEFVDIAGLIRGASNGEGLGNKFLSNIREVNAILHVVRCFDDDNIAHVSGLIDPISDVEIINTELVLSDLYTVEKMQQHYSKAIKYKYDKQIAIIMSVLEKIFNHLNEIKPIRHLLLAHEERKIIQPFCFLTDKPVMYVANIKNHEFKNNQYLQKISDYAKKENLPIIPICLSSDTEKQKKNIFHSNLSEIIQIAFDLLRLHTFFTAGKKELRSWTIPIGTKALQAAGKIHSDFEKGFIRAQVIAFQDFLHYKGESSAKEAGKIRSEGKDYLIKDGDIIHFLFHPIAKNYR